jgi:hypothetical protein
MRIRKKERVTRRWRRNREGSEEKLKSKNDRANR